MSEVNRLYNFPIRRQLGIAGVVLAWLYPCAGCLAAQVPQSGDSVLKQHYELAQSFQSSGNFVDAARQYRIFIADALAEMALQAINLDDYSKAAPLFDEALVLAPRSPGLKVRYAQGAFAAHDLARTRTLAEGILRGYPENAKAVAKAHLLLGRVLMKMNQEKEARKHFEAAVALDPNFENGYALAVVCLDLEDGAGAAKIFTEMIAGLGDMAALHVEIGRAYLNSDFQQEAIPEFKKAIAEDGKLPGAHYSLAVAYLTNGGDNSLDSATSELEAELKLSPNDPSVHAQLGDIALRQHRYPAAEQELKRASSLDPSDPNAYFYLGQLYADTERTSEAIADFRLSIALTKDPAQNHFQVQKAHYLLGHLLLQSGETEVGRGEMQISAALLKRSLGKDRDRLAGDFEEKASDPLNLPQTPQRREAHAALESFERDVAPVIADSYNNLGVIAAKGGLMAEALVSFQRAYEWNPGLAGLNDNWGLAAFQSGHFAEAIAPLGRSLQTNPSDTKVRSELAISDFRTGNYSEALKLLEAIPAQVEAEPDLAYVYAASLVSTGEEEAGMKRLLALETVDAKRVEVHTALARLYAARKDFAHADRERAIYEALTKDGAEQSPALP